MRPINVKFLYIAVGLVFAMNVLAQSVFTNQTYDSYYVVDRLEVLAGTTSPKVFSISKPYRREQVLDLAYSWEDSAQVDTTGILSSRDRFNIQYLKDDNWDIRPGQGDSRRPVWRYFYTKKNALYSVEEKSFKLIANPVLSVWAGKESNADKSYNYHNSRGVELRGNIDNRLGFYTYFTDNQSLLPQYVRQSITPVDSLKSILVGEGYIKNNNTGTLDYISARGYITFDVTKHIALQFGHDKNFFGNGYRSLLLSDNSAPYNFLKFQTNVWKLQYTNLFCQLTAVPTINDSPFPKKYMALHHLSLNLGRHLNVGLFESVVYGNRGGGFDLNYLNPIIFYRAVEQNLGSSDNALLGADWKLNFLKHFSWYGQVMIDEFLIKNVRAQNGSWTNKQALQTGLKYFNAFGLSNLDLQAEVNAVRPYTYAHLDYYRNYAHYLQPLAHPRGANFLEWIGLIRCQPVNRLQLLAKAIYIKQGVDSLFGAQSVGSNVLKSYKNRVLHGGSMDVGHKIGQGVPVSLLYMELAASYMVAHNVFVDLAIALRRQSSSERAYVYNSSLVTLGLRANVSRKSFDW